MKTKILKIAGISLLVLVTFVAAAPWLFKGKISKLVKARFQKDLQAHVSFTGVNISYFRHFPKISIGLDSLRIICVGEFQDDTLFLAKQLDLACNLKSLISGDSIRIHSITLNQPKIHLVIHKNGHTNWNIRKTEQNSNEPLEPNGKSIQWGIQAFAIHEGSLDFQDERKDVHMQVSNLEQEGAGDFNADQFTLKTKSTSDELSFEINGSLPYRLAAKTNIEVSFHVDKKTHTYSFNTDRVAFNELKLHTEGSFQWINDSSYAMNIRWKVPSTKFKDFLSMLPSVYQKDFGTIEANGQVNFNGFVKGKWDENHRPAYHVNLYVMNSSFKYPDLPVPVENINIGLQVENPDGISGHQTINLSQAHAEINKDTVDGHLLIKNMKSKPFIDLALTGRLDLSNISKWMKPESGTKLSGIFMVDIYAKGNIPEKEKRKKNPFQSGGNLDMTNFSWVSNAYPSGINLSELLLEFNSKDIQVKQLKGEYGSTHFDGFGSLNNFYDFALGDQDLNATMNLKADGVSLREWARSVQAGSTVTTPRIIETLRVPEHLRFTINAEVEAFHFDNLDLQNLSGKLFIADQTIRLENLKANGLDGEMLIAGTYSTQESRESPEIALIYDVKGLNIQKSFIAFNTLRKIMPVMKFMSGNYDAHMSLNGRLHEDMTTDLGTLEGEGNLHLLDATLKDFGPMDKLSKSLDIDALRDVPLKDIKAEFSFKTNRVTITPFLLQTKDIGMLIGGGHGFDQSLDYVVTLKVPRDQLGKRGSMFVRNVVEQAAVKGIPVRLNDAVNLNVKMGGTINKAEINTDMDAVVNNAETDLKKEMEDFVNAKLDSAKEQLHKPKATSKKSLFSQASYESKNPSKTKKAAKKTVKKTHSISKKKKKKTSKHYTASLKKERSVASSK